MGGECDAMRCVVAMCVALGVAACSKLPAPSMSAQPPRSAAGLDNFSDVLRSGSSEPNRAGVAAATHGPGGVVPDKDANTQPQIYNGRSVSPQVVIADPPEPTPPPPVGITHAAYLVADNVTPVDGKFQVTFENADITAVARAILGDSLKANYAIDPRVHGAISLSTPRPISRSQLLLLLENALHAASAIMVSREGSYRILPAADASGIGSANIGPDVGEQGFGITALPLQNISADALNKILTGFGANTDTVHVDAAHNLLIVRGSTDERQWLIDTALAFDVDWMRNQSIGIFPISNSSPEIVINELNQLADSTIVRFQPIARLNAILVVGKNSQTIRQVQTWISRLDHTNDYGPQAHIYRLKSIDAKKVVSVLRETFGTGSSSSGSDQTAPGGGLASATAPPTSGSGLAASPTANKPPVPSPVESRFGDFGAGAASGSAANTGKIRITADAESNSVVVYASNEDWKAIERAIIDLDHPSPEVAIEAIAAQVTLNDTLNYGVQFFLKSSVKGTPGSGPVPVALSQLATAALPLTPAAPGTSFVLGALANPSAVIDALRDVTDVKILSSPSLVVANNQAAVLQVGDQVPVTTGTATSVITTQSAIVNSVSYVDTGVILHVTPHVSRTSEVRLDIEQEVSAVEQNANAQTLTPTISQQKVKSTIVVNSGQTILLAGLISQQRSQEKAGVPGVIDVPILGNLVSSTNNSATRTELIIFVKPQVIRNHIDAQQVAQELRRRMPGFNDW
jgi:general secretion pathway protein D